ncbi:L,D-transpeptidase [Mycobacterium haemophilum DSM 44634]|uniref:L,D-transpeptidase n=1 Tax=Mycobacterium haemophilum TaxID=29311 RepID=A0A0I9U732_9MYCO|nr:L,D-transpeptidase [Mycobacterium haemophilum DSM 44634]KLO33111.1 L,D-transpeptidase [Mycobacterium haemophilum]KLO38066.1 L,D-transpeptidase [Mycobacterium haemophilum]KLO44388.1 L,D-transpeptidase [Mycobacterium haemophilum]KLO55293.1 L,D-transpeptidase [Mycobacterium haemophilum]
MSPSDPCQNQGSCQNPEPISRRVALTALGVGVLAPSVLAACVGKVTKRSDKAAPAPHLTFQPAPATDDVIPVAPISVQIADGWFQRVALTNPAGKVVAGAFNFDRTVYTITEPLGYDTTYTWSGSAVGHDGKAVPVTGKFSTVTPTKKVDGGFQLADGQTVGVAAPIIIQFDAPISDKAAVEKALTVTTTPPVEGSWAWLPDEAKGARIHYRPREYYPAGTTVNVDAKLYGLPFGDGAYGLQDMSLNIQIGRRQVVKAEVSSHRIQVVTDAGVIMDFPCSYGEADKARNVTRNGIHVVTEKYSDFYMSNPAAGYSNVHERWAVRISNNGEFIHANPMSAGAQGNSNVTNGCINLSTGDAEQYYRSAIYGDPVEVTGSSIQLSYSDGDIWDWAVDWDTWVAMSALPPPTAHPPATQIPITAPVAPPSVPTLSGTPTSGSGSVRPGG